MMSFEKFIFYVFSLVLVFAATMVITRRNPVHAVLFLVLAFFNAAGLWMLLEAEFLALVLVLVYVGAVMVLFLFVVMMLIGAVMIIEMLMVVGPKYFGLDKFAAPAKHAADFSNTEALGMLLYTDYLYPFEIAAVILLVAIIAAISLTLRRRPDRKYIDISKQLAAKKADRLRVVKMESEK